MAETSGVPADLVSALHEDGRALQAFETLEPAHRRDIVEWVEAAEHSEHRAQRVKLAVKLILESPGRR